MNVRVAIPNNIARILQDKPNAGRVYLQHTAGISEFKARFYCTIWQAANSQGDDPEDENQIKIKAEYTPEGGCIAINSLTIVSLSEALKISNCDQSKWEVERHLFNSWGVTLKGPDGNPVYRTNYQVKFWVRPKRIEPMAIAMQELIDQIPTLPRPRKRHKPAKHIYAGEMALYDVHLGKFAWGLETGQGNMDLKVCERIFMNAAERHLNNWSPYSLGKIVYIVGQDFMHFENQSGVTPHGGHVLDVDSRLPKVVNAAIKMNLQVIRMCREVAPVDVLWVPGNHDIHSSYWLCQVIKQAFANDPHVAVDDGPEQRKARLWGNLLVGFTHDAEGRKQAVSVNMLPQYWPELWAKSRYREWHTGHLHKKNETKFTPVHTVGGVVVRRISAMSTIDFWHYDNAFTDAVPAGESFLWSKESGVEAHFTSNIDYSKFS
jgi:hypothetical protein